MAARLLGPLPFGLLSTAVAAAAVLQAVVLFGFDTYLLRGLLTDRLGRSVSEAILRTKVLVAMVAMALAGPAYLLSQHLAGVVAALLILTSGALAALSETPETVLASQGRYVARTVVQSVPAILCLALVAVVGQGMHRSSILVFAIALALRESLRLAVGSRASSIRLKAPNAAAMREVVPHLRVSWPFAAVSVLGYLYFRVDLLILAGFRGPVSVAYYSAAYIYLTGIGTFMTALGPILLERLIRAAAEYGKFLLGAACIGTAAAVLVATLGPWSLGIVYGSGYTSARPLLIILAFTLPFTFLNSVGLRAIYAFRLERHVPRALALALALNLSLNLSLVPAYGALACASATVVTEIFLALAFYAITRRREVHDK